MSEGMLGMLPLSEVQGPRDTLDKHLASREGRVWLDALNKLNRKENPWQKPVEFPFRVWRTIMLGCQSRSTYVRRSGQHLSQAVVDFLHTPGSDDQIKYNSRRQAVDFVKISVGELGFEEEKRNRIHARGLEMGLELCLPEDPLALAREPVANANVAMEAIVPDGPRAFGFIEGTLHFIDASPFEVWGRQTIFIFRKPRR